MRVQTMAVALLITTQAFAANKIPDGTYVGKGTWTDTENRNGTLTLTYKANGFDGYNKGVFCDGRVYEGNFRYDYANDSDYKIIVEVGGQEFEVGQGVAGPGNYSTTNMIWSANPDGTPNEIVNEMGQFSKNGPLTRVGTIFNKHTGVTTFYFVELRKHGN
jgi:hypothetical protein